MKLSKFNIKIEDKDQILIYNSYTKASIYLPKNSDTLPIEDIESFKKFNTGEQKILIENGFVIDDDKDELSELKYIFEKNYFNTDFLNIALTPSLECNFECPYCCEKSNYKPIQNIEKYFKTLRVYAEKHFKTNKNVQLSLFGGEPLLYAGEFIDFLNWVDIDSKKNGYGYITTIVTNGSLLTNEIINNLLLHNLRSLQITIDGDKETHNQYRQFKNGNPSFDILIDKIELVLKLSENFENFKFTLRLNLNNTTVEKVSESISNIKEEYRDRINLLIRPIYNTSAYRKTNDNKTSELSKYIEMGKKLGFQIKKDRFNFQSCEACADSKFFYLLPDLSMWKCINDLDNENACIGRINDDGEPEIKPENVVNWYKYASSAFIDNDCLECKLLPDCLGGCILHKCKYGKKSCRSFDMTSKPYLY